MPNSYVTPKTFRFLKELAANNDREWFQANKQRYEEEVRNPALHLIGDFTPHLAKISKNLLADPRPMGGSLFRIHRDTRFAKDKTPYKTHVGITFRHVDGKDVHGPILYLHIEPGTVFAAAGMWYPQKETLAAVRDAIAEHPERWKRVLSKVELGVARDPLKRPPRGYDPDHPFIEDLKRKSFTATANFTQKQAMSDGFLKLLAGEYQRRAPLLEFLAGAVGLPW